MSLDALAHTVSQALASGQPVPVGLDTEWRPDTLHRESSDGPTPTALLQIAFLETIYLLDLQQLSSCQLDSALLSLFVSDFAIKIGFGWSADLSRLHCSFPTAECFMRMKPVVDLSHVRKAGVNNGLNRLVETVLGSPLDKSQQVSDWSLRPLTTEQVSWHAAARS